MRESTLLFLIHRGVNNSVLEICLPMKKRGFGSGRYNGVGGKVQKGETVQQAAKREASEEIEVCVENLYQVALLTFIFPNHPEWDQLVTAYFSEQWTGEPQETEEMNPFWFPVESIPYTEMWPDDILWLPKCLAGQKIEATFIFGEQDIILDSQIETKPSW